MTIKSSRLNRALSSAEVGGLYRSGKPYDPAKAGVLTNLAYHYRLGTGDVYPATKELISGNHGSMIGMTSSSIVTDAP